MNKQATPPIGSDSHGFIPAGTRWVCDPENPKRTVSRLVEGADVDEFLTATGWSEAFPGRTFTRRYTCPVNGDSFTTLYRELLFNGTRVGDFEVYQ